MSPACIPPSQVDDVLSERFASTYLLMKSDFHTNFANLLGNAKLGDDSLHATVQFAHETMKCFAILPSVLNGQPTVKKKAHYCVRSSR